MKSAQSVLASRGRGVMLVSVDFERLRDPGVVALLSRCSCPGRAAQGPSSGLWVPPKLRFGAPPSLSQPQPCLLSRTTGLCFFPPSFFPSCFQDFHILFRNPCCGLLCCEWSLDTFPFSVCPRFSVSPSNRHSTLVKGRQRQPHERSPL
ncbi:hypothetical protein GE21DRAFT_1040269 [Neurospora crassa]|nr:hypothetical protein GE21DRAFT_1040269 [Neurospora crassa]